MISRLLKNNRKYLFSQRRWNSEAVPNTNEYHDVIPFSFAEIDKIAKNREPFPEKSINIDKSHRDTFYTFIRHTNSVSYSKFSLKRPLPRKDGLETPGSAQKSEKDGFDDEHICSRVEKILPFMSKDNLIIILQRSLSAHHHLKSKTWYRLSTRSLRHCFLSESALTSRDLVKVLASLSKWRFTNLSEFEKKLDFQILMNHSWTIYEASQVLWSLSHLNLYTLKGFDYLNGVIAYKLSVESDLHTKGDFYGDIHRIASANLTRLSRIGVSNPIMPSIVDYLGRNPSMLKCLDPKTVLSVTSLFPHAKYNDELTVSLLKILTDSFHKFTHIQATHILYNFAVIHSTLSLRAENMVVKLLCKFRDLVLSSDFAFIPSVACKLLYTSRLFLNSMDIEFVSKCLSDLNANLHLLGPFSLFGNLLCLNNIKAEFSEELDSRLRESIESTNKNLLRLDKHGNPCKLLDGVAVLLENVKLWQLATLPNLGVNCDLSHKFNEFYETCTSENHMSALKNLLLFVANSFGNREFTSPHFKNLALLTCCKLYTAQPKTDLLSGYWDSITCYLSCLNILEVFKREVNFNPVQRGSASALQVKVLRSILGKGDREPVEEYMKLLTEDEDRVMENSEILTTKLWLCTMGKLDPEVCREIFEDFYAPKPNVEELDMSVDEKVRGYLTKCARSGCEPIPVDFLYSKLFFLQDHPRFILSLMPSIIVGEALRVRRWDFSLGRIAEWLEREKGWACLSQYLRNRGTGEYKAELSEESEIKHAYTNWELGDMKIDYVLEEHHVGPWLCPYVLKNRHSNQTVLIFLVDHKFNKTAHAFDEVRRNLLSKFGYCFVELFHR